MPQDAVDVFISYSRHDRERVVAIADLLRSAELSIWFDAALQPGISFDEEIAAHLSASKSVLVCWSPLSVASRWVRSEASIAAEMKKLVSISLAPCTLPPPFNIDHTEDLSQWSGDVWNPTFGKLLQRIGQLIGRDDALCEWYRATHSDDPTPARRFLERFANDPLAADVKRILWNRELAARISELERELGSDAKPEMFSRSLGAAERPPPRPHATSGTSKRRGPFGVMSGSKLYAAVATVIAIAAGVLAIFPSLVHPTNSTAGVGAGRQKAGASVMCYRAAGYPAGRWLVSGYVKRAVPPHSTDVALAFDITLLSDKAGTVATNEAGARLANTVITGSFAPGQVVSLHTKDSTGYESTFQGTVSENGCFLEGDFDDTNTHVGHEILFWDAGERYRVQSPESE